MVQAPYYGDSAYRTPPPDLASLILKERIIYLGAPLYANVTSLIISQLLYLQFDNPDKPINFYINSTGTCKDDGQPVGFETEAFAICDTMAYIKPPIHTICIGQATGAAAMILSCGTKNCRASLPNATIVLSQSKTGMGRAQATDIQIRAKEILDNKAAMLNILARNIGHTAEKIAKDMERTFYLTPTEAQEYGLIDRVLTSAKDLPTALPVAI
jgi:ATP-dependent Clp protease, protease subunit